MEIVQQKLILAVLEEITDKLIVTNRGYFTAGITTNKKEPVHIRFKNKLNESVYHKMDPFQLSGKKLNEIRINDEINSIITIFKKTQDEIENNSTFDLLKDYIKIQHGEIKDEEKLKIGYKKNLELLEKLQLKNKSHFFNIEVKTHCRQEMLNNLKNRLDNIKRINAIELDLVVRWEQTRFDQALIYGTNEEKMIVNDIEEMERKLIGEERFICEMETFYKYKMNEYENKIKYWKNKYDIELNEWNDKINQTNINIEETKKQYNKYYEIHEEHRTFINEYLAEKAEEQLQLELQLNRVRSAIKIQAWWRGTMVRKCLGPYKKKKKGKKGKKGGK